MTVKELRTILATAADDDPIFVTRTHYNGDDDETDTENAVCILTDEGIVISDKWTMRQLDGIKL